MVKILLERSDDVEKRRQNSRMTRRESDLIDMNPIGVIYHLISRRHYGWVTDCEVSFLFQNDTYASHPFPMHLIKMIKRIRWNQHVAISLEPLTNQITEIVVHSNGVPIVIIKLDLL